MIILWIIDYLQEFVFGGFNWLFWALPLTVWTFVWQGIALWRSGKNNQFYWFLVNLILGYGGVFPILYIFFFQKKVDDFSEE